MPTLGGSSSNTSYPSSNRTFRPFSSPLSGTSSDFTSNRNSTLTIGRTSDRTSNCPSYHSSCPSCHSNDTSNHTSIFTVPTSGSSIARQNVRSTGTTNNRAWSDSQRLQSTMTQRIISEITTEPSFIRNMRNKEYDLSIPSVRSQVESWLRTELDPASTSQSPTSTAPFTVLTKCDLKDRRRIRDDLRESLLPYGKSHIDPMTRENFTSVKTDLYSRLVRPPKPTTTKTPIQRDRWDDYHSAKYRNTTGIITAMAIADDIVKDEEFAKRIKFEGYNTEDFGTRDFLFDQIMRDITKGTNEWIPPMKEVTNRVEPGFTVLTLCPQERRRRIVDKWKNSGDIDATDSHICDNASRAPKKINRDIEGLESGSRDQ